MKIRIPKQRKACLMVPSKSDNPSPCLITRKTFLESSDQKVGAIRTQLSVTAKMMKLYQVSKQRGVLFPKANLNQSPICFFTTNIPNVRAFIVPVIRCADTHVWIVYCLSFFCFVLLINFLSLYLDVA
jgi:hypothetical protein